ncbi:MAG: hypothetical protein A2091_07535 [Desulfuromonadales bacterium GWD2_61_12]|nr:MAG: hypothetical protein A2005_09605 [Desulfuromonadales bacterium GWC2_61_20]OGR36628.1 MAG: hypothetical protein A2091_07535 [Desulfuromonadales bacterium GWD2_61_12]HBT82458.1 hypothetical protein [Desulfuromonas sp.]
MQSNIMMTVITVFLFSSAAGASGDHAGGHGPAATIGQPGKLQNVTRTITIDMSDAMRYTPAELTVTQGETVRFVVRNSGKLKHEMVLGTEQELTAHYEVMKKNPEMEHADENMVTVQPGATGEIVWQFTQAGKIDFACLLPGHYEAGMKGTVRVSRHATAIEPSSAAAVLTEGVIRKIDKANNKITIKHGEIKNLEMPGMTMVFQVRDPLLLDKVVAGDKVKFRAEKSGSAFIVTDIQPE